MDDAQRKAVDRLDEPLAQMARNVLASLDEVDRAFREASKPSRYPTPLLAPCRRVYPPRSGFW